jgi:hypothetical protein
MNKLLIKNIFLMANFLLDINRKIWSLVIRMTKLDSWVARYLRPETIYCAILLARINLGRSRHRNYPINLRLSKNAGL